MRNLILQSILPPLIFLTIGCQKKGGSGKSDKTPETNAPVPVLEVPSTPLTEDPSPTDPASQEPPTPGPIEEVPTEVTPPPTELKIIESQFWIYSKIDGVLSFNSPWDEIEGDGIVRDENLVPDYARDCLKEAKDTYANLAVIPAFQEKIKPILATGATPDLTFLVVSSDSEDDRNELRKLDRDAYFWHWNYPAKKPVLSLNQYEIGTWVWEVIATPKTCIQPVIRELGRYLDWTARRQIEKGANP